MAQVHCHQEAKGAYGPDRRVLQRLGASPGVVEAGCCGAAGNFGSERGHWEVSQACAEQELHPRVRAVGSDTHVLVEGFSCRPQIRQEKPHEGTRLAQLLYAAPDGTGEGRNGPDTTQAPPARA